MPTLVEYINRYPRRRFVVVGKGRTPFDYARLAETTDPIIFLNDAVQLAPLARRSSERFFFATDRKQAVYLDGLAATPVLAESPDSVEKDIVHPHNQRLWARDLPVRPENLVTYRWGARFDEEECGQWTRGAAARDGRLCIGLGGTIHPAIHFAWLCGAAEIAFIGCDGRHGGYDPRIEIRSRTPNLGVHGRIRENQDRLCGWLDLETEYIGRAGLVPLIPRILHFVWLNGEPPPWVRQTLEEFAAVNGDKWDVRLWTQMPPTLDAARADLPAGLAAAVDGCRQVCQQADILYCLALDRYGGMVFDCDHVPLRPLEPLRRGREAWTTSHNDHHRRLTNGSMGAVAGSRAFRRALAEIPKTHRRGGRGGRTPRCAYGPDLLTRLFSKHGNRDMDLLPWHYFYPYFCREAAQARRLRVMDADGRRRMLAKIRDRFAGGEWPYTVHEWGIQGSSHREVARDRLSA